jgi:DNA polymerase III gamma/tau subunit
MRTPPAARAQKVIKAAVNRGLLGFENDLSAEARAKAAQSLGAKAPSQLRALLEDTDIDVFVNSASTELLRMYATQLRLDVVPSRDELRKTIADELMLTGAERFLTTLPIELLGEYCKALGIKPDAPEMLVEQIMVAVFHLSTDEPSVAVATESPKATSKSKEKTKTKKDEKEKKEDGDDDDEESEEEEEEKLKKKGRKKKEPAKRKSTTPKKPPKKKKKSRKSLQESESEEEEEEEEEDEKSEEEEEEPTPKPKKPKKESSDEKEEEEEEDDENGAPRGKYDESGKWVAPPFEAVLAGKYTR